MSGGTIEIRRTGMVSTIARYSRGTSAFSWRAEIAFLRAFVVGNRVPEAGDGGLEVVSTGGARVVDDGGALGAVVGVGVGDAAETGQPLLDAARARGARHPVDR
jgi:hypothetical protein